MKELVGLLTVLVAINVVIVLGFLYAGLVFSSTRDVLTDVSSLCRVLFFSLFLQFSSGHRSSLWRH
jgi:hypothetical protein